MYHNIQSLSKHWLQVANDNCFTSSDVIILGETWTLHTDDFSLPGFTLLSRIDCDTTRVAQGICVFVRHCILQRFPSWSCLNTRLDDTRGTISISRLRLDDIIIVGLYVSPKVSSAVFATFVDEQNQQHWVPRQFLIGDFNNTPQIIKTLLEPLQNLTVKSDISKPTTSAGTTIDLVLSNTDVNLWCLHVMTSYHEPLWCWAS